MLQRVILFCKECLNPLQDTACLSHHLFITLCPVAAVMADQLHCQRPVTPVRAFHADHCPKGSHAPEYQSENEKPHCEVNNRRNNLHTVPHARKQAVLHCLIYNSCRKFIQIGNIYEQPHKDRNFKRYIKHLHLTDIQLSPGRKKQSCGNHYPAQGGQCITVVKSLPHTVIWNGIIFPIVRCVCLCKHIQIFPTHPIDDSNAFWLRNT